MNHVLSTIIIGFIIGFLTSWSGIFTGIISSSFIRNKGNRLKGTILGILGGFMLGVVCFDLLPETFASGRLGIAVAGIVLGLFIAVMIDGKLETYEDNALDKRNNYFKIALFMMIGFGLDNFPSGVAVGSLMSHSPENALHLIIALVLHGIPEGLALGILLTESKTPLHKQILISFPVAAPMGLGSMIGGFLNSSAIICVSLAFASAILLYITLRETIPAASETWRGRTTTIGNVMGVILGLLMVTFLH